MKITLTNTNNTIVSNNISYMNFFYNEPKKTFEDFDRIQ